MQKEVFNKMFKKFRCSFFLLFLSFVLGAGPDTFGQDGVNEQSGLQKADPAASNAPAVIDTMPTPPDEKPLTSPRFKLEIGDLPAVERIGVDPANQFPLTLEDAIKLALEHNNDIEVAKKDVQIAELNLKGARGVYDPAFSSESYYESITTPVASLIGGAVNGSVTQNRYFGSAGLEGFSPVSGGSYSARFDSSRSNTSNTNAFLNPQFPSVLSFTYTQPLFRNRRFDNNRRLIEIAKKNLSLSDSQFRQRAIEVISAVERAYWDLAFALRDLQVRIDAVKQARAQLESNSRMVEKGVIAPIDLVAAGAQVATLEQGVHIAGEQVTRAENLLKTLMLPDRASEIWARPLTPVSPVELATPKTSLETAIAEALRNRPEIGQLEAALELNKVDQRYYRDQTKPQIDLVGSYSSQGLAGTETTRAFDPITGESRVPANLVGGYTASLGNLLAQDYPTYRVGVTINLPWGNTTAKANFGRTLVEKNRIENLRAKTEQTIEAEVRNAIQALRSAEARLASATIARTSAEQLYQSEQRQFRAGTTTFYLVQQRQTELLTAQGNELQAQTDLNKAISEFQRVTGTTLSANNVDVTEGRNLIISDRRTELRRLAANRLFGDK